MLNQQFQELKNTSMRFRTETASQRIQKLIRIKKWVLLHEPEILAALKKDFAKPEFETTLTEIMPVIDEINTVIKNLSTWMRSQHVPTPLTLLGHTSCIRYENKGVVLIISPWNYPFQLAITPLITALAAGNTVVLKPSELTGSTSNLMLQLAQDCFSADEVLVVQGGKEITEHLLQLAFDHVFFTGSTAVGRIIAKSCAEKLIPTTLELGGKSPTVIDTTANLSDAAEKIFWGKFLNRGQTCVAPDYVIVHESIHDEFVSKLKALSKKHTLDIQGQIISDHHQNRLNRLALAQDSINFNQTAVEVICTADLNHPAMIDEIFGPLLPLLKYQTFSDLEKIISHYEKPLALYVFSKDKKFISKVLNRFPSGGVGINSIIVHLGNHFLPFGGLGSSGMGRYHGYHGFLELSHQRATIEQRYFKFLGRLMYPPYSPLKKSLLQCIRFLFF
ncbi:MAG: hypothetical protein A2622_12265 [Bdellovibrionales bacterium RIFCSPHIGHO2_01_FULL_40_29]|nr:MAG: hypothetical protein A2622_12265 [Bdellovibrionales bacterium RIFCSPHIGHO2_01_FULL_40_29]OFZ32962.1 MAG: hypothetical protein A3D17_09570 [Bdellovibrionales bacterium RIFCSPHIGHO2_02_FULL_40_15]